MEVDELRVRVTVCGGGRGEGIVLEVGNTALAMIDCCGDAEGGRDCERLLSSRLERNRNAVSYCQKLWIEDMRRAANPSA